jgi:uncharacterized protein involved in exopolysaccharide biosynthesis
MLPGRQYTPEELLRLLWFRRWIVIVSAIFATLGAVALSMQIKNVYRSETLILVIPQRVPESYVKTTMTSGSRIGCGRSRRRSSAGRASRR